MSQRGKFFNQARLLLPLCLLIAGCSGEKAAKPEDPMKEIPTTEGTAANAPEAELIVRGKRYFEQGLFSEAQENFKSIMTNYPLSPYAEFAEIKNADSVFNTADYLAAAQLYEEFLKGHPGSDAVPYVLYRAARSNQLAQKGKGRDLSTLDKAVKYYDDLAAKYPDSNYTFAAKELRSDAHKMLAEHEQEVAEFYSRKNKPDAAQARSQIYNSKWQPILQKDSNELKQVSTERDAQLKLAAKTVESTPLVKPQSLIQSQDKAEKALPQAKYHIYKVECRKGTPQQVFVYFNKDFDQNDQNSIAAANLQPKSGMLNLQFPETSTRKYDVDCFGDKDLNVSENGLLSVKTSKTAKLMTVSNPSRAIIVFE